MSQGWLPILSFHFVGCHHEAQNPKVPIHSKNCLTKDATGIDQVLRFLDKTEREDPPSKASYLFFGVSATWTYKNVWKTKNTVRFIKADARWLHSILLLLGSTQELQLVQNHFMYIVYIHIEREIWHICMYVCMYLSIYLSIQLSMYVCMCDVWCVMCDVWCVMCDVWCVMCDVWCVMCDVCCVLCDVWCVMCDVWYVICDMWCDVI